MPPPEQGSIGWIDDPAGQARRPLVWDRTGHLALVGAIGSGTTTALLALADDSVIVHVIDARGDRSLTELDDEPNCSGVIGVDDHERVDRVLRRLVATIDDRRRPTTDVRPGDRPGDRPDEVLLIDGFEAVRRSLDEPDRVDADGVSSPAARLRRILAEGPPVGVVIAAVVEPESGGASLARFQERWLFHVDDPAIAGLIGLASARVPAAVPGRLVIGSCGLDARIWPRATRSGDQAGSSLGQRPGRRLRPFVPPVGALPPVVTAPMLVDPPEEVMASDPHRVLIGQRFDDLGPARLDWLPGEPVVVAGPRGSGRTTALDHLVTAWRVRHPDGEVAVVVPHATTSDVHRWGTPVTPADLAERWPHGAEPDGHAWLIVVDDADRVDDHDGVLARLAGRRVHGPSAMVLAGRADGLRAFDHWAAAARRRRCGFVLTATSELDGDVLGVAPPRRCPLPPRPGLAWMIAHGDCALVQLLAPV